MIATATPSMPGARAEALTGRDYLSYSSVSLYQSCPLRWYFKYVADLPEDTVSASLVFGGAIHRAVEFHFREVFAGNPAPDIDTLLAEYQDAWQEHDVSHVAFTKDDDVNTLGELAERMLETFRTSDFAKPEGTILGIEEEFRGQLVPGCPELLARIDLLFDMPNELVISDLKTARARWTREQAHDACEQLLLYSELVKELAPGKPLMMQFIVLTKTKRPVVDRYILPVDARRVERAKRVVEQVWRGIEAGLFYPAPSAMNCPTCPFREPCRAWAG